MMPVSCESFETMLLEHLVFTQIRTAENTFSMHDLPGTVVARYAISSVVWFNPTSLSSNGMRGSFYKRQPAVSRTT
jgi:hypothetical protein